LDLVGYLKRNDTLHVQVQISLCIYCFWSKYSKSAFFKFLFLFWKCHFILSLFP